MSGVGSTDGASPDPGLGLHEWESTWASIDDGGEDDPDAAVSQYADLVHRMLVEAGYRIDDPVEAAGDEPEIVVTYLSSRDVAERAELGEASRDEVRTAIDDLRAIFETLVAERP